MASSFNSKEILKILPINKRPISPSPARIISGLYVAGVWRPPHYIDRTLIITGIRANTIKVSYYTTIDKRVLPGDMAFGHKNIRSTATTIVHYTRRYDHILPGNMAFGHKDIRSTPLTLKKWTRINKHVVPGDMAFGHKDINASEQVLSLIKFKITQVSMWPQGKPSLWVKKISSEHVIVEQRS